MFTIGEFARHGRISVRMLRHYDGIGLLTPDRVDPSTGYRFYRAAQLSRLNRIVALKDLGFTLHQVHEILDDRIDGAELRGMLRLRQAELREQITADTGRLADVDVRLRAIENEGTMSTNDVVVKQIPTVRVAELTGRAAGYNPQSIGPVIQPLYTELCERLERAGVSFTGPAIAYYEDVDVDSSDGEGAVLVHAAMPVDVDGDPAHDFAVVDLPEITAATVVHRGSMDSVLVTWQELGRWIDANGHSSSYSDHGYAREVTLEHSDDPAGWVTELQVPIGQPTADANRR